jgi:hypothetical protein
MTTYKKGYKPLKLLTSLLTLAGIVTLLPYSGASKESMLGYKAMCSFAPISTIFCFLLAGTVCKIRKKKFTED